MKNLLLGRYIALSSIIHRLDPRLKLVVTLLFIASVLLINNWETLIFLIVITFILMKLSQIGFKIYLKGIKPLIYLILFTVVLQVLFKAGGEIYVEWGIIKISSYGIEHGIFVFFRFVLIIILSTILTLTTKPIQITDAIYFFLKPLKLFKAPIEDITLMLSIALRFIPTLLDETERVMQAQMARGVTFGEGNLLKQMQSLTPIFLPLFANSLNRAEEMANGLEVRGYQVGKKRTSYRSLVFAKKDGVAFFLMIIVIVILFFLRA